MARTSTLKREADYYPLVRRWMASHFHCFASAINRGVRAGRIDVVGVRDIGGDLTGEVEVIAIEVKKSGQPFATRTGQSRGYSVYAHRVYLAEVRDRPFDIDEIDIASALGVGLIHIRGRRFKEVLSSPLHQPLHRLQANVLDALGYGRCVFCGTLFDLGRANGRGSRTRVVRCSDRVGVATAESRGKGMMYWLYEVNRRLERHKVSGRRKWVYPRRYVCADCVYAFAPERES